MVFLLLISFFFGEKIPVEGETILGKNFVIGPGGKGSNQAVAAAKTGAKTFFISKIGDDQFGSMATEIYENSGVDYSNVIISKDFLSRLIRFISQRAVYLLVSIFCFFREGVVCIFARQALIKLYLSS